MWYKEVLKKNGSERYTDNLNQKITVKFLRHVLRKEELKNLTVTEDIKSKRQGKSAGQLPDKHLCVDGVMVCRK